MQVSKAYFLVALHPPTTNDRKLSFQLFSPPHKSLVLSSDSLTHLAKLSGFLSLKPTLKGFGSVVKAVGILLHSNASSTGASAELFAGTTSNAVIMRRKLV